MILRNISPLPKNVNPKMYGHCPYKIVNYGKAAWHKDRLAK